MKKVWKAWLNVWKRLEGLPMVYLGVFLLLLAYVLGLTDHNVCLFLPLAFIVVGIVSYVIRERRNGSY